MDTKKHTWAFFFYALAAFAVLALELVLMLAENAVYGAPMEIWQKRPNTVLLHWFLIWLIWGGADFLIVKLAKKHLDFKVFDFTRDKPTIRGFCVIAVCAIAYAVYVTIDWNGFKPYLEFQYHGVVKFCFQYIYYMFECIAYWLIIVFAQKFGEKLWKNPKIPYGGIMVGLTWGLGHILTKNLSTGLESLVSGVLFGIIYLASKKNAKFAFPVILLIWWI
ncbi:hypothetical protein AGMMS49975_07260 [Clostridia bacterium]|nr:hypothetical protein AGMMS49975_07260 [Clostridia bacterium]